MHKEEEAEQRDEDETEAEADFLNTGHAVEFRENGNWEAMADQSRALSLRQEGARDCSAQLKSLTNLQTVRFQHVGNPSRKT